MRHHLAWSHTAVAAALALSLGVPVARAQVSLTIGVPGVRIGLTVPVYPELVQVPGYPVYYDPHSSSNYFFYDGLYWVYQQDSWYSSAWYDGPWRQVGPEYVPLFVLRIPVRYYRRPPSYFSGWQASAAPLPTYQRRYAGVHYPSAPDQQHQLRTQNYRHQPGEAVSRQLTQPSHPSPQERGRETSPEEKARGQEGRGDQREKDR